MHRVCTDAGRGCGCKDAMHHVSTDTGCGRGCKDATSCVSTGISVVVAPYFIFDLISKETTSVTKGAHTTSNLNPLFTCLHII